MVDDIKEDDFDVDEGGQVEIIGWLYQYYNIEPHDKVVNINGGPIKTNDIPAATQLFTTDWVVRYMVDNSLGRLYLEYFPDSPIKEKLFYLLPGPIEERTDSFDLSKLKVLDDAMGSGHILVYAFDLLIRMYEEQGYGKRDATDAILAHNLYGLEIDKRAYQLAYFALMMKARQYNRRILSKPIRHNLHVFESTVDVPNEVFEKINASKDTIDDLHTLVSIFRQAKLLGSIMHFEKKFDFDALFCAVNSLPDSTQLDLFGLQAAKNTLQSILRIAQVLQTHFDVVATNPPYLNRMNGDLKKYVKKYYKAYSGDLFSVFIWKNIEMTKQDGYSAYMTPFVWMFIKTYEGLRKSILDSKQISSLIQMEYSAFEEATVPINTFVLKNDMNADATGTYLKLSDFKGGMEVQKKYVLTAIADPSVGYLYRTKQTNFEKVPGSPIAYWVPHKFTELFTDRKVDGEYDLTGSQHITADNKKFLRYFWEINSEKIGKKGKWARYSKGGPFRKYYGNNHYVVDISLPALKFYSSNSTSNLLDKKYWFKQGIAYTDITSGKPSFRFFVGGLFDKSGPVLCNVKELNYLLGLLNSKVFSYYLPIVNPTIHMQVKDIKNFPIIHQENGKLAKVKSVVQQTIEIAKSDYSDDESSNEFENFTILTHIAEHQKSPTTKLLIFFDFCDKYVPIQFRGLIFYGKLSKKR
ncbi:BREX-1 system adenine-specific DNA-methyltransferase PglX [Lacticaseibacillus paracasei]|uniref:site-specific DNA-methyltransferase (adenine-specific) n=1 Tax=Lacticaseibacillus paracasei subsp. tolerans Lpl14 TaxID=1256229 RepID=A0A829GUP6_LACPA|nr:type II restriction enzyme methyltransferase [Lacticaseibacillus paracasei subsp. tolerans Lpl14]